MNNLSYSLRIKFYFSENGDEILLDKTQYNVFARVH